MAGKWILAGAALGLLGASLANNNKTRYYYCNGNYYTHKGGTVVATKTNVKCKCGAMMILITPKTVYGRNAQCNLCFKTIGKYLMCYHCPLGKNHSHPTGFDYCQPCIANYQMKMSQQQQPKVVYVTQQQQPQTIYVSQQQKVVYANNTQPSMKQSNSNPGYPGFKARNSNSGYPGSNNIRNRAVSSNVTYTNNNNNNNNNNMRYRAQSQFNNNNKSSVKKKGLQDRWLYSGYMSKQGEWFKTWRPRYFKFGSDLVLWYYEKKDENFKGKIDLNKLKTIVKKKSTGFDITLSNSNRVWSFLCNSPSERDNWYNIISSHTIHKPKPQSIPQPSIVQQPPQTYNNNNNVSSYQPGSNYNNNYNNNPNPYQASNNNNNYNNNNNNNNMNYNYNYNYNVNNNIESKEYEPGSQPGDEVNEPGSIKSSNNNYNNNNNNNNASAPPMMNWESNDKPPPPAYGLPSAPPED